MTADDRLRHALAAVDAANADDPNRLEVRGTSRPKELAHAELASEWIARLVEQPSDALRIAARAHHMRRWQIPRTDYPPGRDGYRRWRKDLQRFHAERVEEILVAQGYDATFIDRVGALVRKEGLGQDVEVQALEDALCLIFLETQLDDTAVKLDDEDKTERVLRKTLRKMSATAVELIDELPLTRESRELLERTRGG